MSLPVGGLSPSILDWAFREGCSGFGRMLLGTVVWRAERNHKRSCLFHSFFLWPLLPTHWHSDTQWDTHTLGRTSMGELSALRRDRYLTTHNIDRHPCHRWDPNPQSQHLSGLALTPWTTRPPVSVVYLSVLYRAVILPTFCKSARTKLDVRYSYKMALSQFIPEGLVVPLPARSFLIFYTFQGFIAVFNEPVSSTRVRWIQQVSPVSIRCRKGHNKSLFQIKTRLMLTLIVSTTL